MRSFGARFVAVLSNTTRLPSALMEGAVELPSASPPSGRQVDAGRRPEKRVPHEDVIERVDVGVPGNQVVRPAVESDVAAVRADGGHPRVVIALRSVAWPGSREWSFP